MSSATATEGDEVTYTVTASNAPTAAVPVVVQVRAHGEVMDTRTVVEVFLPAGATTVTLRLEEFTDEIDESPVNVTLTLAGGTGYSVGDPAEATVGIDYPSISGTQATPTPAPAVSPPAAPSDVSVSATTINSFTISWTAETGKTYRVEREAAFLFSYRVWQTVADDLSSGSFTENGLSCGLYYLFQVRAKVTGSAFGDGTKKLGHSQSCPSTTSAGSRNTRDHVDPPKLRVVTDNPTEDKIQIRLLLFGPTGNEEQYTPIPASLGLTDFQVDRSKRVVGSNPKEWPDSGTDLNTNYRKTRQVAEFDWTGLECGASYHFRARSGKRTVSSNQSTVVWGHWSDDASATPMNVSLSMSVHGSTRGCTLQPTPAPAPASVSAVLEGDSSVRVSWTWDELVSDDIVAHKLEWEWHDGTRTRQDSVTGISADARSRLVGNLQCSTTYTFKVSGRGDGDPYSTSYGDTKADTASTKLCAPELDVIPLRERRVLLTWDRDEHATGGYKMQIRLKDDPWPDLLTTSQSSLTVFNPAPPMTGASPHHIIRLDTIVLLNPGGWKGLADHPAYDIRIKAMRSGDDTLDSDFSEVTIVDNPILSVDGDSYGVDGGRGKMEIRWRPVDSKALYTVRWRKLPGDHRQFGWAVAEARRGWDGISTPTPSSDHTAYTPNSLPDEGEIYAVQLNYTIEGKKHFSAREAYAWVSARPADNGERVATFPLTFPAFGGTFLYRICESTFPSDNNDQSDWRNMIVNALDQWEAAVPEYVSMTLDITADGKSKDCANYDGIIELIKVAVVAEMAAVSPGETVDAANVGNLVTGLGTYMDFIDPDMKLNEIIWVDIRALKTIGNVSGTTVGVFPELAEVAGFNKCVFESPACAVDSEDNTTVDILVAGYSYLSHPSSPTVEFNKCLPYNKSLYETLVHEAGHVLGIGGGERIDPNDSDTIHHPAVADSAVNYNRKVYVLRNEPDCSPHSLDIMAIYALHQSR